MPSHRDGASTFPADETVGLHAVEPVLREPELAVVVVAGAFGDELRQLFEGGAAPLVHPDHRFVVQALKIH